MRCPRSSNSDAHSLPSDSFTLAGFSKAPPPPKDTEDPAKFAKAISASQSLNGLSSYNPPPPPGEEPGAAARNHPDQTRLVVGKDKDGSDGLGGKPGAAARLHPERSTKLVLGTDQQQGADGGSHKTHDRMSLEKRRPTGDKWKKKRKMDCGKATMCGVLVLETG